MITEPILSNADRVSQPQGCTCLLGDNQVHDLGCPRQMENVLAPKR